VGNSQHTIGMPTLKKIGQNIARVRREQGITQEELAGLTEIDRSYLSEIENAHKNLSVLQHIHLLLNQSR